MTVDNPWIALIYFAAIAIAVLMAAVPGGLDRRENVRLRIENAELKKRISKAEKALSAGEEP